MREVTAILEKIFAGRDRLDRQEIVKRAVDLGAPVDVVNILFRIPDGMYTQVEAEQIAGRTVEAGIVAGAAGEAVGVPATDLADPDLIRELAQLHVTRHETLRHASDQALDQHTRRMAEMEAEYLRRFPEREIEPERLRAGARSR